MPAEIRNKPRLHHGLDFYMQAFEELSTCRNSGSIGKGIRGIITWQNIDAYALRYNIIGGEYEFFKRLMFEIDFQYLEMLNRITPGN